jgi:hypothetical protein
LEGNQLRNKIGEIEIERDELRLTIREIQKVICAVDDWDRDLTREQLLECLREFDYSEIARDMMRERDELRLNLEGAEAGRRRTVESVQRPRPAPARGSEGDE